MNKTNNKRTTQSKTAIQRAYLNLVISRSDINTITVSDICKKAKINRTTFYAHYFDINDLIDSIQEWMINEFLNVFKEEVSNKKHSFDFEKLFRNIKDNQIFYKIYFKLGFDFKKTFTENGANTSLDIGRLFYKDTKHIDYHIEFFSAGITAIIKKWLDSGCKESPHTMGLILVNEYRKKNTF